MQSRLAIAAARSYTALLFEHNQYLRQHCSAFASIPTRRPADPAVHAGDYDAEPAVYSGEPEEPSKLADEKLSRQEKITDDEMHTESFNHEPPLPPKPPRTTSPPLHNPAVKLPSVPNFQQKRNTASTTTSSSNLSLEDLSCVGFDGTPLRDNKSEELHEETEQEKDVDDREYFKNRKASPLSEIEMADTRKPITIATDGAAGADVGNECIGWKPEQLKTAEETMMNAAEMWMYNASRGDPDAYPHSRVLRELRGEWF